MTTSTALADTWDMPLVHRVFRREFHLLPAVIRDVEGGDTARAQEVGAHLADVTHGLHHHHRSEDELLWPIMLDRVGLHADVVRRMESQHERLASQLDLLDDLNTRWRATADSTVRDELAGCLTRASAILDEHLGDEERELLPLARRHVTQAEWDKLSERGRELLPKSPRDALVMLGGVLEEATPEEKRRFLAELPAPARLLWRIAGPRTYAKSRARLRADAPRT